MHDSYVIVVNFCCLCMGIGICAGYLHTVYVGCARRFSTQNSRMCACVHEFPTFKPVCMCANHTLRAYLHGFTWDFSHEYKSAEHLWGRGLWHWPNWEYSTFIILSELFQNFRSHSKRSLFIFIAHKYSLINLFTHLELI